MIILALPQSFVASVLVPYMGVVLISIYLVFVLYRFPARPAVKEMMLK
jgi:hypothetical protein